MNIVYFFDMNEFNRYTGTAMILETETLIVVCITAYGI